MIPLLGKDGSGAAEEQENYSKRGETDMGRMESKSMTVAPSEEQTVIKKHEIFGWELKSSQEVLSKDSHLEERGEDLYSVTTTQNYVKLVFQRDAESDIAVKAHTVEDEYWSLYSLTKAKYFPTKSKLLNTIPLVLCVFMLVIGVIALFQRHYNFGERIIHFLISLAIAAVFFGVSYAYRRFVYQRKVAAFMEKERRADAIEADMKTVFQS